MSLFNVIQSCVVNGLHYVHPTSQPIEVDDEQAADLVVAGSLEPYPKPQAPASALDLDDPRHDENVVETGESEAAIEDFAYGGLAAEPKPRSRARRRTED